MHKGVYKTRKILLLLFSTCILLIIAIINQTLFAIRYKYFVQLEENKNKNPGSYLSWYSIRNHSFCIFNYGLPHGFLIKESDDGFPPEEKENSSYRILPNVVQGRYSSTAIPNITYVTQATVDFLNYIAEIVRYWDGLISISIFTPSEDADVAIKKLNQLCHCLPGMSRVGIHFVYPKVYPPIIETPIKNAQHCNVLADENALLTFRDKNHLTYPINVGRNVARLYAPSRYLMASDIQLIPSENMASTFLEMIKNIRTINEYVPRVFVVPVFEIRGTEEIPRTKERLTEMVKGEKAFYFHRHVCLHCQKFPGLENWLSTPSTQNKLKPFLTVKREYPYHRWEPIFIGTNHEPLYSEALTWEGWQDKMIQMLELCLLGYRFTILDNAFLVHWPEAPKSKKEIKWRVPFKIENIKRYRNILNELSYQYHANPLCKLK